MVVCDDHAIRADKRSGAAVIEAHARQPDVVEKLLRGRKVVFILKLLQRRIVEGPHPFIGCAGFSGRQNKHNQDQDKTVFHHNENYDSIWRRMSSGLRSRMPALASQPVRTVSSVVMAPAAIT